MISYLLLVEPGAMAERLKALVLKTSDTERYRGFESLSLRSPALEKYPSGRRGSPAKGVVRVTAARVQIPASPLQNPRKINVPGVLFLLCTPTVPQRAKKYAQRRKTLSVFDRYFHCYVPAFLRKAPISDLISFST